MEVRRLHLNISNTGYLDGLIDCADSECCSSPSCSNHPLCISDLQRLAVPGLELGRPETSFKKQIEFLLGPDSAQKYADLTEFDERQVCSTKRSQSVRILEESQSFVGAFFPEKPAR